jgi:predicted nucleic acid-binding protein
VKLFLDANVLFTAAYSPDGRASALFLLAGREHCELLSSRHAIDEAQRNIAREAPARTEALNALLQIVHRVPEADPRLCDWAATLDLPPGDAPILAAAVASAADLLVTGDRRHFGPHYGQQRGVVLVVTPAAALEAVLDAVQGRGAGPTSP